LRSSLTSGLIDGSLVGSGLPFGSVGCHLFICLDRNDFRSMSQSDNFLVLVLYGLIVRIISQVINH
jgi:hypothetical protein